MRRNVFTSTATVLVATLSTLSLIASTSTPTLSFPSQIESELEAQIEDFIPNTQGIEQDNTLLDGATDITIDSSEDQGPPFEEADVNIEEQEKMSCDPKLEPDVQKVLYDPNMNYGTGAPVPKPAPITTVKRNLIVLGTSTILATIAMLVVASGKGRDASH